MKRLLLAGLLLVPVASFAYERTETLVGGKIENGGFVAPAIRYTELDGKWGLVMGSRAGWVINHRLVIGGAAYGLVRDNLKADIPGSPGARRSYFLEYGGIEFELIGDPDSLVHPSFVALLGAGNAGLSENAALGIAEERSAFFVLEPGVTLTLNVTKHFRASLGASYRLVTGVDSPSLTNTKVNGPSAVLTFKLGIF